MCEFRGRQVPDFRNPARLHVAGVPTIVFEEFFKPPFVTSVPRRMCQALAESMGIETDWNCAISLRPLEDSTQPDPHRMTSDYADWDVKVDMIHLMPLCNANA